MKGPAHAPRTGPGYSAGKAPPKVSTGSAAHPKASSGNKTGTDRGGDKKASTISSGRAAAGDQAMMRKPYR